MNSPKRITRAILVLVTLLVSAGTARGQGINMGHLGFWSPYWAFVDAMKQSRPWQAINPSNWSGSNVEVPLDENGYPLSIPYDADGSGPIQPVVVKTGVFISCGGRFPAGDYTLMLEGQGKVRLAGSASGDYRAPGRYTVPVKPTNTGLWLTIMESQAGDNVRNVRIILPGFADNYDEVVFHPRFVERLAGAKVIRFVLWTKTINSEARTWEDRTKEHDRTQVGEFGVSWEVIIDFCNRYGISPWLSVPHLVDDHYMHELAKLVRDRLDPRLKCYLEYSCEIWNWMWTETHYSMDMGLALGLDTNPERALFLYNVRRSGEMFKIFRDEFGASQAHRVVNVIAGHATREWYGELLLAGFEDPRINPGGVLADAYAIAPYFGNRVGKDIIEDGVADTVTIDEVLDRLAVAVQTETAERTRKSKIVADKFGIDLISYEGGNHLYSPNDARLTDKFLAATRHPRIRDLYRAMFKAWKDNGGGHFTLFKYVDAPEKFGAMGVLEHMEQPTSEAPIYQAYLEYMSSLDENGDLLPPAAPTNLKAHDLGV